MKSRVLSLLQVVSAHEKSELLKGAIAILLELNDKQEQLLASACTKGDNDASNSLINDIANAINMKYTFTPVPWPCKEAFFLNEVALHAKLDPKTVGGL